MSEQWYLQVCQLRNYFWFEKDFSCFFSINIGVLQKTPGCRSLAWRPTWLLPRTWLVPAPHRCHGDGGDIDDRIDGWLELWLQWSIGVGTKGSRLRHARQLRWGWFRWLWDCWQSSVGLRKCFIFCNIWMEQVPAGIRGLSEKAWTIFPQASQVL